MQQQQEYLLERHLADNHGVVDRATACRLGITAAQIDHLVARGRWVVIHRSVYARSGSQLTSTGWLAAACLAVGPDAVASHRSAGALWGLCRAPERPALTVPNRRVPRLAGVEVHRRDDLDPSRTLVRTGIPLTDPLRTLADLGEVVPERELDDAIDCGRASGLVTVGGLRAEVGRLARSGRRGVTRLREALDRRGMLEPPAPSVLESRVVRRLKARGIIPLGVEVAVLAGRYRLDFLLRPTLALEVDGYAYHWSPEAKAADSRRRNAIRLTGVDIVEADWFTVVHRPEVFLQEVLAAVVAWDQAHADQRA